MTLEEKAKKLWKDVFGNVEWAQDCFGTWMHRDAHSNEEVTKTRPGNTKSYDYSWNIDHIRPKSDFKNESEADFFNNYEPMHRSNNQKKSDSYPDFEIDGKKYKVVKDNDCYGIADANGNRIDWKYKQGKKYE